MRYEAALRDRPPVPRKCFLDQRISRRTDETRIVIKNYFDRHILQQVLHSSLIQKRFHEDGIAHLGNNFRGDAAADENSAGGHEIQRAVAGF